ncbi:flagellar hook-length control protein FliK [Roseovarius sp. TE539]|uniref:flagellar hook-length control protein FliK n=1 Tax=Roseovarius sp. TE539 TaxID=2249812 RepID=UPI0015EF867E|nr:flagellar hook-length control protein FliK [Roseovarius sp. TE539]
MERGKAETPSPAPRDTLAQTQLSQPERQPRAALPPDRTASPPPLKDVAEALTRGKAETPVPAPRETPAETPLSRTDRQTLTALPPASTANPPPLQALAEARARNRTGIAPTHRDGVHAPRRTAPSRGPDAEAPRPTAPSTQAPLQAIAVPVPPPPAQAAPAQAARAFTPAEPYDRGDPELRAQSPADAPRSGGNTLPTSGPAPLPTSDGIATARQIAAQIATGAARGADRPVDVVLNPAELGRVRLSMTASDGMMIVSITADRAETLDLMRRHSDTLAQEFQDIGYEGTKFEFGKGSGDGNRPDTSDQDTGPSFPEDEIEGPAPPGTGIATAENSTDRVDIRL